MSSAWTEAILSSVQIDDFTACSIAPPPLFPFHQSLTQRPRELTHRFDSSGTNKALFPARKLADFQKLTSVPNHLVDLQAARAFSQTVALLVAFALLVLVEARNDHSTVYVHNDTVYSSVGNKHSLNSDPLVILPGKKWFLFASRGLDIFNAALIYIFRVAFKASSLP